MKDREIKERPVLFNAGSVQMTLAGRMTQFRRVVKPQPPEGWGGNSNIFALSTHCPYGQPGDRLWVRETFANIPDTYPGNIHYRANACPADEKWFWDMNWKWTPSIFMPRWASRIDLLITGVRVERLQDISEADAIAEGVRWPDYEDFAPIEVNGFISGPARIAFNELWDSINAKRGYGWSVNPWVWVVEFERA